MHDNNMKIIDYEDDLTADELNKPVKTFTVKFPFYKYKDHVKESY